MKKYITSLIAAICLVVLTTTTVWAAHYWEIKMSDPSSTNQTRTFNIEFVALSEESTDSFTVKLYQNNSEIASRTTTKPYGDSGSFQVTVPTDGSYTYHMTATTSGEEVEEKNTPSKTVTVSTPTEGGPSTVSSTESSTSTSTPTVSSNRSGGSGGGSTSATQGDSTTAGGQVDDQAATDLEVQDVLGEDTEDGAENSSARNLWLILAVAGVLAALYYWFYARKGQLYPFNPKED